MPDAVSAQERADIMAMFEGGPNVTQPSTYSGGQAWAADLAARQAASKAGGFDGLMDSDPGSLGFDLYDGLPNPGRKLVNNLARKLLASVTKPDAPEVRYREGPYVPVESGVYDFKQRIDEAGNVHKSWLDFPPDVVLKTADGEYKLATRYTSVESPQVQEQRAQWEEIQASISRGERVNYSDAIELGRKFNPSSPWARIPDMKQSLLGFGLTTATGVGGIYGGGYVFNAIRARTSLFVAGSTAGFTGNLTTQVLDNGVYAATGGQYGRTGVNVPELGLSTVLGAAPGLPGAVRGWAQDLRSVGLPDWNIRLASSRPGVLYSNPLPLELERIAVSGQAGAQLGPSTAGAVPTVVFSRSRAPGLAANFDNAVANGVPTQLNRVSAAVRDANRRAALRGQAPAPAGQSLDEYPFASSAQGGQGSFVRPVPVSEQSYQGGVLSRFYQNQNVRPGDPYIVEFEP